MLVVNSGPASNDECHHVAFRPKTTSASMGCTDKMSHRAPTITALSHPQRGPIWGPLAIPPKMGAPRC